MGTSFMTHKLFAVFTTSAVSQMKLSTYTRESLDERKLVPPEGHASACPDQADRVATAIQNSITHCTSL